MMLGGVGEGEGGGCKGIGIFDEARKNSVATAITCAVYVSYLYTLLTKLNKVVKQGVTRLAQFVNRTKILWSSPSDELLVVLLLA